MAVGGRVLIRREELMAGKCRSSSSCAGGPPPPPDALYEAPALSCPPSPLPNQRRRVKSHRPLVNSP